MSDPIRLSKRLAEQLGCSRREAELYIEGGWVSVDEQIVETPHLKVDPTQRVELRGGAIAQPVHPVTLLLHKPAGQTSAADAASAQQQLLDARHWAQDPSSETPRQRHFARQTLLLPLDPEASGLEIFSQRREVIRKLTDPRNALEQEFVVEVAGEAQADDLALLAKGIGHRGRILPKARASWQSENRLRIVLKAPQAGDLRQLCEAVGLRMLGCKRIRIGRLPMARLPLGEWRYLGEHERF